MARLPQPAAVVTSQLHVFVVLVVLPGAIVRLLLAVSAVCVLKHLFKYSLYDIII